MNFVLGFVSIILGLSIIAKPEAFLHLEDLFRVKGERTYSDVSIILMRLRGIAAVIIGIVLMFIKF